MEAKETTLTLDARNWKGESVLAQIYADDVLVGDTRGELQVPLCTEELRVESSDGSWLGAIQLVETGNQLSVALSRGALQSSLDYSTSSTVDYPMVNVQVGRFWMGSTNSEMGRNRDEQQHQVLLTQSFSIGVSEVTQGVWSGVTGQNHLTTICGLIVQWKTSLGGAVAFANMLVPTWFAICCASWLLIWIRIPQSTRPAVSRDVPMGTACRLKQVNGVREKWDITYVAVALSRSCGSRIDFPEVQPPVKWRGTRIHQAVEHTRSVARKSI